jgi:hypothetical protein
LGYTYGGRRMNEDEIAQMFLDECLYNAGIIDKSPFDEDDKEECEGS